MKFWATEREGEVLDAGVQLHGGTNEIMRDIVSRKIAGKRWPLAETQQDAGPEKSGPASSYRATRSSVTTGAGSVPFSRNSGGEMNSMVGPRRRPTINEVALRAGVSRMTVSRTLSGGVNVKPELQNRVFTAVSELGYHRNENARSIRPGQSSGLIGVTITNIANPYYSTFALGVEEEVATAGRRILLGNTSEDAAREAALVRDFLGRQVDGLIVVPAGSDGAHLRRSQEQGVPVVLASRRIEGLDADSVVLDDEGGAYRGVYALINQGHTRIAYLGDPLSIFTGKRRHAGYTRALQDRGIAIDAEIIATSQQNVEEARDATRAFLRSMNPPTAIFCANNRNAIGAIKEIHRQLATGLRSPAEFPEIASFDDFELAELSPVPISVIDHDPRELGRAAARLLLDRLDGHRANAAPRELELPVTFRLGPR